MKIENNQYKNIEALQQGGVWCIYWKGAGNHIHITVGEVVLFDEKLQKVKVVQTLPGFETGILIDFDSIQEIKQKSEITNGSRVDVYA